MASFRIEYITCKGCVDNQEIISLVGRMYRANPWYIDSSKTKVTPVLVCGVKDTSKAVLVRFDAPVAMKQLYAFEQYRHAFLKHLMSAMLPQVQRLYISEQFNSTGGCSCFSADAEPCTPA